MEEPQKAAEDEQEISPEALAQQRTFLMGLFIVCGVVLVIAFIAMAFEKVQTTKPAPQKQEIGEMQK